MACEQSPPRVACAGPHSAPPHAVLSLGSGVIATGLHAETESLTCLVALGLKLTGSYMAFYG